MKPGSPQAAAAYDRALMRAADRYWETDGDRLLREEREAQRREDATRAAEERRDGVRDEGGVA